MNKATLSTWLRRARLMHLADVLRFRVLQLRHQAENQRFRATHPGVSLPPDYLMYESFKLRYRNYYQGGRETAKWVRDQLAPYTSLRGQCLLDWGCGPGRVVRHLPDVVAGGGYFIGTDANAKSIAWCQAHLPGITFLVNALQPPLALGAATVDAAYGISILTHLSRAAHASWLAELHRVLRPGGVLLLTTHGAAFQAILTPAERAQFEAGELVERRQAREGHRVFAAFQPPAFMRALLAEQWEVLHHTPGQWQGTSASQDVWLLRKP